MNISNNVEILNIIYQGSHMAINTINMLDEASQRELLTLLEAHYHMAYLADKELHYLGQEPIDLNIYEKVGSWPRREISGGNVLLLSPISELVEDGTAMILDEIIIKLDEYKNLLPGHRQIAESFISLQKQHLEIIEKYI